MLIEAGILLAAYSGIRLFEKFRDKPTKNVVINQPDRKIQPSVLEKSVDNTDKKLVVHEQADKQLEHRLKISYISMVVSTIRQFFYSSPLVVFLNIGLYMYNSAPYMKEAEKKLLKEQKISELLDTIIIIAAIAFSWTGFATPSETFLIDNRKRYEAGCKPAPASRHSQSL